MKVLFVILAVSSNYVTDLIFLTLLLLQLKTFYCFFFHETRERRGKMLREKLSVITVAFLLFRTSKCEDASHFYSLAAVDINGNQVKEIKWLWLDGSGIGRLFNKDCNFYLSGGILEIWRESSIGGERGKSVRLHGWSLQRSQKTARHPQF